MVYLNTPEKGGGTCFPELGHTVMPSTGKALVWNNLLPSGQPNRNTIHHALPVEKGYKAVLTKWFRARGDGQMLICDRADLIPSYTSRGFEKRRLPESIYRTLLDFYQKHAHEVEVESLDGYLEGADGDPSHMLELPVDMKDNLSEALKPIMEYWCGRRLTTSAVYGLRRYNRGASLAMHRDTIDTHIISAIINLSQGSVDTPWALAIEDNNRSVHNVCMNPGEIIMYESAKLRHGRPQPLDGEGYVNVFVHFRPTDYFTPEPLAGQ